MKRTPDFNYRVLIPRHSTGIMPRITERHINSAIGPASVAQLDARSTGDQEVAGSTTAGSVTFFHGGLIMNYFLRSFSPFR